MSIDNELPLFPLNTVLFPGGVLPLRIFEARYLDMVGECMRRQTGFGVCAIRSGSEVGQRAEFHSIGTLAMVEDFDRGEDGLLYILARGERRFRCEETWVERNRLLRARVHWLEEGQDAPLPGDLQQLARFLGSLLRQAGTPYSEMETHFQSSAWVAGRLAELLPFALTDKQRLLEMGNPLERLETLYNELLAEEVNPHSSRR